jgi:hypothetical protein
MQAKLGEISLMNSRDDAELRRQVGDMMRHTRAPKILEIVEDNGQRLLHVHSGARYHRGYQTRSKDLARYFTSRVITTLDGDTRPAFVGTVQDSTISRVQLDAVLV